MNNIRIKNWLSTIFAHSALILYLIFGAFYPSKIVLAGAFAFGTLALAAYFKRGFYRSLPGPTKMFLAGVFLGYPMVLILNKFSSGYMHGPMVISSIGIAYAFGSTKKVAILTVLLWLLAGFYLIFVMILGSGIDDPFLGSRNRVSTLFLALAVFIFAIRQTRYDICALCSKKFHQYR